MILNSDKLKSFAVELFKINAIKFGEYKTKIGLMTPVYCDLRVIVSHPKLMGTLADLIVDYSKEINNYDVICGVPYTALPIATIVSYKTNVPMVMRRKEAKDYGTKKLIEGTFKEGDKCLIIEDVVTSGSSILETVKDLKDVGLKSTEAIVLLDREQGGKKLLKNNAINMHSLLTMTQLLGYLKEEGCISEAICLEVSEYLKNSQVDENIAVNKLNRLKITFEERVKHCINPLSKKLFQIMCTKKSNLCIAADLTDPTAILNLAESVGPHICLFKTHVDIIHDFNDNFVKCLTDIAKKHNFILFEDRKFADIGKSVELQYSEGVYKISQWAPLVTAHALTGSGVLEAIKVANGVEERGVFLLAETSAKGSLIDEKYAKESIKMGLNYKNLVTGFVCQSPQFIEEPGFIQLTPGVQLESKGDNLGQQYNTPDAIIENGADIGVVGRGITKAANPEVAACEYKTLLWNSYLKRVTL